MRIANFWSFQAESFVFKRFKSCFQTIWTSEEYGFDEPHDDDEDGRDDDGGSDDELSGDGNDINYE